MIHAIITMMSGSAWAWPAPATVWNIQSTMSGGPMGTYDRILVDRCPVNINWATDPSWGCPASDNGRVVEMVPAAGGTWRRPDGVPYAKCYAHRTTAAAPRSPDGTIDVAFVFETGHDGSGNGYWPSSWPAGGLKCAWTTPGGAVHTYPATFGPAPATNHTVMPIVWTVASVTGNTCTVGGSPCSVTLPAAELGSATKFINLPDANYTWPVTAPVPMKASASPTAADMPGTRCLLISGADDWLTAKADKVSASGTFYCGVTLVSGGVSTTTWKPIVVSTP